jgi:hypothetical protein
MANTPWGQSQEQQQLAPGLVRYDTASHGGYHVTEPALGEMPAALRAIKPFAGAGWYEEDCDWAIVALAFPQYFGSFAVHAAVQTVRGWNPAATAWLDSPEGEKVRKIAAFFAQVNGSKFRRGCEGTSGKGWWINGTSIDGKRSVKATFPSVPNLPAAFTVADVEAHGGTVTELKGAV